MVWIELAQSTDSRGHDDVLFRSVNCIQFRDKKKDSSFREGTFSTEKSYGGMV